MDKQISFADWSHFRNWSNTVDIYAFIFSWSQTTVPTG